MSKFRFGKIARRVARNMRWGAALGLGCSVIFVTYIAILRVVRGPHAFTQYGVTFKTTVLIYVVGGLGGGMILGLVRPLTRRRSGGILTGILIATFAYGAVGIGLDGWVTRWDVGNWVALLLLGLGVGAYGGNRFWEEFVYPTLPPPRANSAAAPRRRPLGIWRP